MRLGFLGRQKEKVRPKGGMLWCINEFKIISWNVRGLNDREKGLSDQVVAKRLECRCYLFTGD
jgi:hypothetical protein